HRVDGALTFGAADQERSKRSRRSDDVARLLHRVYVGEIRQIAFPRVNDMEAGIARAVEDVDCLRHDRSGRIDAARKLAAEAGRIDEIALEIDRHQGGRGRIELETPVGVAWNRMRHRPELPGRIRRTAI